MSLKFQEELRLGITYARRDMRVLLYCDHLPPDWEDRLQTLRDTIQRLQESYESETAKITMREVIKWL